MALMDQLHQLCRSPPQRRASPSSTNVSPIDRPFRVTVRSLRRYWSSSQNPATSENRPALSSSCNRGCWASPCRDGSTRTASACSRSPQVVSAQSRDDPLAGAGPAPRERRKAEGRKGRQGRLVAGHGHGAWRHRGFLLSLPPILHPPLRRQGLRGSSNFFHRRAARHAEKIGSSACRLWRSRPRSLTPRGYGAASLRQRTKGDIL